VAAIAAAEHDAGPHSASADSARPVDLHAARQPVSGEVDGYEFAGPTRFDKLFTGIAVERPSWIVPGDVAGTENIGPEDTFDGDYGRLLDRVF
jgi:hypothetical protein